MRLCFISNPNSTHTRRWVNWFVRRGHEVALIADDHLREPWPRLRVYDLAARLDVPVVKYLAWEFWTRKVVRRWRPDILHAHRVSSAGWLGALAGFHPLVVTPWGSDLYQHPQRSLVARRLAFYTLRRADLVTADSEDLRRQAIRFGAAPERVHLVQWGVDLEVFRPGEDTVALRAQLGIGSGPVVLSVRGAHPIYDLETVVEAIPLVRRHVPDVVFVLRDYNTVAAYKESLEAQIARLNVEGAVRWVGPLPRWEDSAALCRLADVVVSVPTSDGTPVSVLEAMACGTAVVASDLPSLREWLVDGENGLFVPVGDAQALAEKIVALLRDPDRRAAFGERSRAVVEARADHQAEMQRMEALYGALLGEQLLPRPIGDAASR